VNIAYERLSRDDEKSKYVSIENQRMIIDKYAKEHNIVIDKHFEDDGFSGYTMDRPDFNEIKHLVDENLVDVFIAKDLSRVGRHNANVLLFLERLKEHGVRVVLVDDNYDSATDSDDIIGIKTWYNERYVKDGSKKVRNALKIMQENATLKSKVPYGYMKDPYVKNKYCVDPDTAIYVKQIFNLYADGNGYKHIAKILNANKIPTASYIEHQRRLARGLNSKIKVADGWDSRMIREIINNDFYIGTLRTRKTVCATINGIQKRTDEKEQFIFENAHEPIIDKDLFYLVQDLNDKRSEEAYYKGQRKYNNPYAGLLMCGDCGRPLTIAHYNKGEIVSYACRSYRDKGINYCTAHSVNKKELNLIVRDYLTLCREALKDMIESLDSILMSEVKRASGFENRVKVLKTNIENAKKELKYMMESKIRDIATNPSMASIISETYDKMQQEKMIAIETMQHQIKEYESVDKSKSDIRRNFRSALEVFDSILQSPELSSRQLNTLIDKIVMFDTNVIDIKLKGELGLVFKDEKIMRMSKEDRIKRVAINYITSVSTFGVMKLMHTIRTTDSIAYETVQALIQEFVDRGYVEQTAKRHKADHPPYVCVATKEQMLDGFEIRTDVGTIHRHSNLGADFETYIKLSTWIQRYI
jgi:DNA invertase Pin-like site-specific DNA recombinase